MSDKQSSDDELMYSADEMFEMEVSVQSSGNDDKESKVKKHSKTQQDPKEGHPNSQKDLLEDQPKIQKNPLEDYQNFTCNPLEEKSKNVQISGGLLVDHKKATHKMLSDNIPKVIARSILVFIVDEKMEIPLRQLIRKREMKAMIFRPRKWDKNTIGAEIEIGEFTQCIVIWRETMDAELLAVLTKVEEICYGLLCIWVIPKDVPIHIMKKRFPGIVRIPEEENILGLLMKMEEIGMPIEKRGEYKWHETTEPTPNFKNVNWNQLDNGRMVQASGSRNLHHSIQPSNYPPKLPTTTKMFFPSPEMPKKGEIFGKIQSKRFDPFAVLGIKRKSQSPESNYGDEDIFEEHFGTKRTKFCTNLNEEIKNTEPLEVRTFFKNENFEKHQPCWKPMVLTSPSGKKGAFFFGKNFVFSNFHSSSFVMDGFTWDNVEQKYCFEKASYFGYFNLSKKIKFKNGITEPSEFKRVTDKEIDQYKAFEENPKYFDQYEWNRVRERIMRPILWAKFTQNKKIGQILLETGELPLFEASVNLSWGIGIDIRERQQIFSNMDQGFKGKNLCGHLLEDIREKLNEGKTNILMHTIQTNEKEQDQILNELENDRKIDNFRIEKILRQYARIKEVVQENWDMKAFIQGSIYNGLGRQESDLDLVIINTNGIPIEWNTNESCEFFGKLRKKLRESGMVLTRTMIIPSRNVSILEITINSEEQEINAQISCNNLIGLINSKWLACCVQLDARFKTLYFAILEWADFFEIHQSAKGGGTLNSYGWASLLIFYLMKITNPVLPNLVKNLPEIFEIHNITYTKKQVFDLMKQKLNWETNNHQSVSSLLIGFFDFYTKINFEESRFDMKEGKIDFWKKNVKEMKMQLFILEPFGAFNVARSVTQNGLDRIKNALHLTMRKLEFGIKNSNDLLEVIRGKGNKEVDQTKVNLEKVLINDHELVYGQNSRIQMDNATTQPMICHNRGQTKFVRFKKDTSSCGKISRFLEQPTRSLILDLFRPNPDNFKFDAWRCIKIRQTQKYRTDLFGYQIEESPEQIILPTTFEDCHQMAIYKKCEFGILSGEIGQKHTNKKLIVEQSWWKIGLQKTESENCFLSKISLFGTPGSDAIHSPVDEVKNCIERKLQNAMFFIYIKKREKI